MACYLRLQFQSLLARFRSEDLSGTFNASPRLRKPSLYGPYEMRSSSVTCMPVVEKRASKSH